MLDTIHEIERAISRLSKEDLARFREWFDEFDARNWDAKFENDAQAGKLDTLANHSIAEFRDGKYKEV